VRHSESQSSLRFSSVREWSLVLARYARTRPMPYRVEGVLVVAYTIVVAVDGKFALLRWLFGVLVGLLGWGLTRTARRLTASDLHRYRRGASLMHAATWLDWLFGRSPLRIARRVEGLIGGILITAGVALAVSSTFAL
jgi:hypothetical protein